MKKVFIISLAVVILMLSFTLPVAALQNRSGNFSKNYTLTGDGGTDMAIIAAAQLGKSAGNLGYSEPWCANFVSDCARLAGQTAAIPEHSYCPTLSQRIRSAGGSVVVGTNTITTPKPGDIIFYGKKDYPALLNNEYHVGIVSSVSGNIIYTIEGNVDGGMVKRSRANSGSFNYHYVLRPNYRSAVHNHNFSIKSSEYVHPHREYMACSCGEANWPNPYTGFAIFNPQCAQCQAVGKPKDVKIETLGKKVTVTWAHTPYTAYYNVYLVAEPWRWADIKYSSGNITGNSYTFTNVAKGDYCGFVVARPNPDWTQSEWAKLAVAPPNNVELRVSNTNVTLGSTVALDSRASNVSNFSLRVVDSNDNTVFFKMGYSGVLNWQPTVAGTYTVWMTALNDVGYIDSERIKINVTSPVNPNPPNPPNLPDPKVPQIKFTDVPAGIWYEEFVMDLVSKGILNGKGENMFDPNGNIKRCEFAKILATASGEDLNQYMGKSSFADVDANIWYAQFVEWAFKHEIVKGKGAGFAPGENISRQEMAVMIQRYAVYKKVTLAKTTAAITFNDDAQIADWAKEAVSLMQQAGIIGGKPGNVFDPSGSATRAEAAKMISIFLKF